MADKSTAPKGQKSPKSACPPPANKPHDEAHANFGAELAKKAIAGLVKDEVMSCRKNAEIDKSVKDFLEECNKAGKNPVSVVKYIADKEGIDLTRTPETGELLDSYRQREIRAFLMKVLAVFIEELASFAVKYVSSGDFDWTGAIKSYILNKLSPLFSRNRESANVVHGDRCLDPWEIDEALPSQFRRDSARAFGEILIPCITYRGIFFA